MWHLLSTLSVPVGLYTSPHICSFRERFLCSHDQVTDEDLVAALGTLKFHLAKLYDDLSFFEVATLLALLLFSEKKTSLNILEVGLGGRLDATNVVNPISSVLVSLDYDHQQILGSSLADIAYEKLHIGRPHAPLFLGCGIQEKKDSQINTVINDLRRKINFVPLEQEKLITFEDSFTVLETSSSKKLLLPLPPQIKSSTEVIRKNYSLALSVAYWLIDQDKASLGFKHHSSRQLIKKAVDSFGKDGIPWPNTMVARFQKLNVKVDNTFRAMIFDVCHNKASVLAFLNSMQRETEAQELGKLPGFVSILSDKNLNEMLEFISKSS